MIKNIGTLDMLKNKKTKSQSPHNSKHVVYNGITLDSKLELKWYKYFELQKQTGRILDFEYHHKFHFNDLKTGLKLFSYESDFVVYLEDDNKLQRDVYDCKGYTDHTHYDKAGKKRKKTNPAYREFLRTKKLIESQYEFKIKVLK